MCQPHQLWRFPDFSKIAAKEDQEAKEDPSELHWQKLRAELALDDSDDSDETARALRDAVQHYHTHAVGVKQCTSIVWQRVRAPLADVWAIIRRFDAPQSYKHFVRSCDMRGDGTVTVGSTREIRVVSGLPAECSTERLDILDDDRHVVGFSVVGGDHRLRNYRSVTTLHRDRDESRGAESTIVLESYVVDVPDGNSRADTCLFADTIVRCNLQSLKHICEHLACRRRCGHH